LNVPWHLLFALIMLAFICERKPVCRLQGVAGRDPGNLGAPHVRNCARNTARK
jgi:hypothetical protein